MVCPKCGKESNSDFKFCTECGYNFNEEVKEDTESVVSDKNEEIVQDKDVDKSNIDNSIVDKSEVKNELNVDKSSNNNEIVNNVDYSSQSGTIRNNTGVVRKKHTGLIIGMIALLVVAIVTIVILLLLKFNGNDIPNSNTFNNNVSTDNKDINSSNIKGLVTKYDNYNVDVTINLEIVGVSMKSVFTGTVDEVNQTEHLNIDVNSFGIEFSMESYSDFKNGYTYITDPVFETWMVESSSSKTIDLNKIINSLINAENSTKIDDNHYKIVIDNDSLKDILDMGDIDFDVSTGKIYADIYLDNGFITEIDYDFSKMIDKFSKMSMVMKLSNHNNAGSVVIPDEVKKSATELN